MVKAWEYRYDYANAYALSKYNSLGHRELKKTIEGSEYLNKTISPDTFNSHLKKMKSHGYIRQKKTIYKKGEKTPYCLTPSSRKAIELGIFQIKYTDKLSQETIFSYQKLIKQKHRTKEDPLVDTRRKIFHLIINSATTHSAHGVSVSNIINGIHGSEAFWYLSFKLPKVEVENSFRLLEKENIIKNIIIPNNEPRFIISDSLFQEFISECLTLRYGLITLRFNLIWNNLRHPSPLEREYHEFYIGKRSTDGVFNKVTKYLFDKDRKNKNNPDYRKNKKEKKEQIESIDYNIYKYVSHIKTKYRTVFKKYSPIVQLYFDSLYPLFLQREIEKTMEKQKKMDGKWIKKPHHGITMITPWGRRKQPPSPYWF